jgi:hypothetical protein
VEASPSFPSVARFSTHFRAAWRLLGLVSGVARRAFVKSEQSACAASCRGVRQDPEQTAGFISAVSMQKRPPTVPAYEADQSPEPSYGTGAITRYVEINPMPKAGGKWNTFEITARGRDIMVVLNGNKTAPNCGTECSMKAGSPCNTARERSESFSELPGDRHRVSANASETEPAKLLAVFVVNTNWQPTASALSSAEPRYAPERLPPRRPTLGRI